VEMGIGESIVYTGLGRPVSCRSTMQSAYLIFDLAKVLNNKGNIMRLQEID